MRNRFLLAAGLALGALLVLNAPGSFAAAKAKFNTKTVDLDMAMRDLWMGHIFWVRNVALETKLGDMQAAKAAEEQVVKNARSIADAVVPYYGKEAADKLYGLLAGHYGAVKDYMNATFKKQAAAQNTAMEAMNSNVVQIADFLSSANPNWPKDTLVSLLTAHGGFHVAQINDIEKKDWSGEAQVWDQMRQNIYVIADALAQGIVKQFPRKF